MLTKDFGKTDVIEFSDIEQWRAAGECLWCAWPCDKKGNHWVKDSVGPIKLDKGTARYPKKKEYQKMRVAGMELGSREEYESDSESDSSGSNG